MVKVQVEAEREGAEGARETHLLASVVNHGLQICTIQNRHLQHSSNIW